MIAQIGALATAAVVTIYAIQPAIGIPVVAGGTAEQKSSAARGSASSILTSFQRAVVEGTLTTLTTLADETGGKKFVGERQFADGFRQITSDTGSYYSIGYRPAEGVPNGTRTLDVRIPAHPEYTVRFGRTLARQSSTRSMNDLVAASLLYRRNVDELGVTVTSTRPVREGKLYKVDVSIAVPLANLTFLPQGDVQRAAFTVHYAATGEDVAFNSGFDRQQGLEVRNAEFEEARTHAFTYTTTLLLQRGATTIAVAMRDPVSKKTSFKTIEVIAR
jgi:hypothetical protein